MSHSESYLFLPKHPALPFRTFSRYVSEAFCSASLRPKFRMLVPRRTTFVPDISKFVPELNGRMT